MKKSSIQYHPNMTQNTGFVVSEKRPDKERSDRGLMFWTLTHLPTTHLHPMMQDSSHECERTRAPLSTVQRFIHAPSSITTSGPIVTLGPIRQFRPIFALGSYSKQKHVHVLKKRSKKEEHSITRHRTNTCMRVISILSFIFEHFLRIFCRDNVCRNKKIDYKYEFNIKNCNTCIWWYPLTISSFWNTVPKIAL